MSGIDLANAREGLIYLVVSLRDSEWRAWRVVDGVEYEVPILVN